LDDDRAIARLLYRQRGRWLPARLHLSSGHLFTFQCLHALLRNDFDVVHCMTHYDAAAAGLSRAIKGTPYVFHITGIPARRYLRSLPHDRLIFQFGLCRADGVVVISRCARTYLEEDFERRGELIPIPVDVERFRPGKPASGGAPKILMAGALDETRKGVRLLARAFVRVKRSVPGAGLQLSGHISDGTSREVLALVPASMRSDVEILGVGRVEDLPRLYGQAAVTVHPAIWEAFGMVLTESLACGTPVVGAQHGGIPDIITSPDVGTLFDPGEVGREAGNVDGLVRAILRTLKLAEQEETLQRCRQHAEQYGWDALGPRFERLYQKVLAR
jgi:phosphatidylinositol alpha-mannosyltransferase